MADYTSYPGYSGVPVSDELFATVLAQSTGSLLLSSAVAIFAVVCLWLVFKKAGKPGWAAIIPIYNRVVLFQICGIKPTVLLWILLPLIGWIIVGIYGIIAYFKLAKAFGKESGFGVGLWLLNPIFMAILAFDKKCTYVGIPQ